MSAHPAWSSMWQSRAAAVAQTRTRVLKKDAGRRHTYCGGLVSFSVVATANRLTLV
jgi:hypothetical protein